MCHSYIGSPVGSWGVLCSAKVPVPAASALLCCTWKAFLRISKGSHRSSYEPVNDPVFQIFFSPIFYFFSLFFVFFLLVDIYWILVFVADAFFAPHRPGRVSSPVERERQGRQDPSPGCSDPEPRPRWAPGPGAGAAHPPGEPAPRLALGWGGHQLRLIS